MIVAAEQRLRAALLVIVAVGFASAQDAIIKDLSSLFPAYELVIFRGLVGVPFLLVWLWQTGGIGQLNTNHLQPLVIRGLVLCASYYCFIMAMAVMPIANAVAIYFTMPFFVAVLAGPFLGERVPGYRWLAMIVGFLGVLIMVKPQSGDFEPASIFALLSALGYAIGQMMGRHYAQRVAPVVIANVGNAVYLIVSLVLFVLFNFITGEIRWHPSLSFMSSASVMPSLSQVSVLIVMGVLSNIAAVAYTYAYKFAQSSFVAPFEYTAMVWAVTYGYFIFGDYPSNSNWLGMAIVVSAGLFMTWRDSRQIMG